MELLEKKLYKLLKEEMADLSMGHTYNIHRIALMKEICHILTYYKYVDMNDTDFMKLVRFFR